MNACNPLIDIGTSVHYWPSTAMVATQRITLLNAERPLHATVAHVYHDRMVNLVAYDHTGHMHAITSVSVVYPGEVPEEGRDHCEIARPAACSRAKPALGDTAVQPAELASAEEAVRQWPVLPSVEQAIKSAGADKAPRITLSDVEANIVGEYYFTADQAVQATLSDQDELTRLTGAHGELRLLTFCVLVLRNGFTVTGESACASAENFNAEIGRRIARENAISKIWPLMGYELRSKLANA